MSKYKDFESFRKESGLTDEELAEAFVFPSELSPEEEKQLDEEISKFRQQRISQMTEEDKRLAEERRLKYSK